MNPPTILLVDDEQEILKIYSRKLKAAGFEVVTAESGVEAIKLAKEKRPDLILLDVKMPVMDGATTFLNLQADDDTKNIKVVFLTAFSDPLTLNTDKRIAEEMGADFIKKGISLSKFIDQVRERLVKK